MQSTTDVLLTSKDDTLFKTIAHGKYGKVILEAILTTKFSKTIIIEKFLNVELPKIKYKEKGKYLDLLFKTNIGYINIEINNGDYYKPKMVRNFMYLCEFLVQNIKQGEKYNIDEAYIQVNLNFGGIKSNYLMTNGKLKNEERILVENFKIIGYSMDILSNICYNDDELKDKYKYLLMLGMSSKELECFYPNDQIIKLYGGELMRLNSKADFVRSITHERDMELLHNTEKYESYKDGMAKGEAKEKEANAKKMKENGIRIDLISKITGLSKKQIMML